MHIQITVILLTILFILFSLEGSLTGAISGLLLGLCYTLYQKKKNKYTEPIYEEEDVKPQELTANILEFLHCQV